MCDISSSRSSSRSTSQRSSSNTFGMNYKKMFILLLCLNLGLSQIINENLYERGPKKDQNDLEDRPL